MIRYCLGLGGHDTVMVSVPKGTPAHCPDCAAHVAAQPVPRRLQVQGGLFHGRVPADAVYVGRGAPGLRRSPFANPHRTNSKPCTDSRCGGAVHDLDGALRAFRELDLPALIEPARAELAGKDLACWCPVGRPCHGDLLIVIAAGDTP